MLVRAFWLTVSCLLPLPWIVLAFGLPTSRRRLWPPLSPVWRHSLRSFERIWRGACTVRGTVGSCGRLLLLVPRRCWRSVIQWSLSPPRQERERTLLQTRRSSWVPRRSLPIDAYPALFAGARRRRGIRRDGSGHYMRWASRTHNLWAIVVAAIPRDSEAAVRG